MLPCDKSRIHLFETDESISTASSWQWIYSGNLVMRRALAGGLNAHDVAVTLRTHQS